MKILTHVVLALLAITALNANAESSFSTLNGVVGESLNDHELASVEAKGVFDKGYCTWFVDQIVRGKIGGLNGWGSKYAANGVPWQGNAVNWLANAKAKGFSTGKTPTQGSVVVYNTKFFATYGHVAYVTSVSGNNFTVREMNVKGWNVASTRTDNIVTNSAKIAGFVYGK